MIGLCSNFATLLPPAHDQTIHKKNRRFSNQVLKASLQTSSTSADSMPVPKELSTKNHILACPICYEKIISKGNSSPSESTVSLSSFGCNTCKKSYVDNETHIDLTVAGGAKEYGQVLPASTEFFRYRLISYIYERGWRQGFLAGGFPGPDKEFEMIRDYLKPVLGGNIVDASCGSGLFSRLFAKSELFSQVIALDYSENMLQQCYKFVKQEEHFPNDKLILVRADIARLPFVSSSIDAVHAGAALHCWPSQLAAVAEISRVLRPGGVFVATTFIMDGPYTSVPFMGLLSQKMWKTTGVNIFIAEGELEGLCRTCGLVDFTCTRNRRFVMISARKPS